jgi:hypothetical protein
MNQDISYFNGFLEALSLINCKTNLVSSFSFETKSLLSGVNLNENVSQFYPEDFRFELVHLPDWRKVIKKYLETYFFRFIDQSFAISDFKKTTLEDEAQIRENLCQKVISILDEIVSVDSKVYMVELSDTNGEFYENEYVDFVFVGVSQVHFLHLGISD